MEREKTTLLAGGGAPSLRERQAATADPGLADLRENLDGVKAAHREQNTQAPVTWGDPSTFRILGTRYPRVEGPDKVTGRAKYTYDIVLPGRLYARIVRSKYA